jgi:hypothetical protein
MSRPRGYAPRAGNGRRVLVVVLAGAALAAVTVLWSAGTSGGPGGAGSAAPEEQQNPAPVAGYLASAVAATDPVASAVAWLQVTRSLSYADGSASGWVARARPVVTDRLAADYERRRDGNAGADWPDFVAAGCVSVVTDASGVIPLEAPRTDSVVNVQVVGRLTTTTCRQGGAAGRAPQDLAATLTLLRTSSGVWLVDRQLY